MTNYSLIYTKKVGNETQYYLKQGLLKDDMTEAQFLNFLTQYVNQENVIEKIMALDSSLLYLGEKKELTLIEQLNDTSIFYKKWFTKETVHFEDKKLLEGYLNNLYHYGQHFLLFENSEWKIANTEFLPNRNKFNMHYFFSLDVYDAFKKSKKITQDDKIKLYQNYIYPENNKKKREYLHYLWDYRIEKMKTEKRNFDIKNYQLINTLVEKLILEKSLNDLTESSELKKKLKI